MLKPPLGGACLSALMLAAPAWAGSTGYSAGWLDRIGATDAVETRAHGGAGVLIGMVDTGVDASNPEISGRVLLQSSCAAVTFTCSDGAFDDNGHGTATASIAAGRFNSDDLMQGVAPSARLIAEKVLDATGTGTDLDVANGIVRAADAGAKVINLSLTYIPTPSVTDAMNYAAGRGAVIVFAGGNASQDLNNGVNSEGLTRTALSHLVFAGSLADDNSLSNFSNRPGDGSAVARGARASYASLWLMAPGENIVAPGIQFGSGVYAYWTGTSMAAPMVAGSIALLEARWPVLARHGTAAAVLLNTATDLGAPGVDAVFGQGELNLTKAFQPFGPLHIVGFRGRPIPVSQVTALFGGGAMGDLFGVRHGMLNFTAFDSFDRDFSVNLSQLISKGSSFSASVAGAVAAPVMARSVRLANGGSLVMTVSDFAFDGDPAAAAEARSLVTRTIGARDAGQFYLAVTNARGGMGAVGRGPGASAAFASALWGPDSPQAFQARSLGLSAALMNLAQGGYFGAVGTPFGTRARLAFSVSQTLAPDEANLSSGRLRTQASAMSAGVSFKVTRSWSAGVSASTLSERNALLGAFYDQAGPLSLGDSHRSAEVGVSSNFDLGHGRSLMLDATLARTSASVGGGVIGAVSALTARGYGVSLLQADVFRPGDRLTLSMRKPLKVIAGAAQLAMTTVDADGYPTTRMTRVSLRPSGDETDLSLGYAASLANGVDFSAGLDYRRDAENVKDLDDLALRLAAAWRF